tara:strand:+ start:244 stop:483 length:240 start_codon:yes stop_codon:yes gene_type:complete
MKDSVKVNVKNGLNNIRFWYEIKYNSDYPPLAEIFDVFDNEWLVENMPVAEDNYFDFQEMDEKVLVVELDRLRSLKSNK